ncbi:hypothetical protein J6590_045084 [Homalodisca vitripennis]|nr:hypothetical protein J6590_045084 [Homalodisca vitripennis]
MGYSMEKVEKAIMTPICVERVCPNNFSRGENTKRGWTQAFVPYVPSHSTLVNSEGDSDIPLYKRLITVKWQLSSHLSILNCDFKF